MQGCVIPCGTVVFFQKSCNLSRSLLTYNNFYCALTTKLSFFKSNHFPIKSKWFQVQLISNPSDFSLLASNSYNWLYLQDCNCSHRDNLCSFRTHIFWDNSKFSKFQRFKWNIPKKETQTSNSETQLPLTCTYF